MSTYGVFVVFLVGSDVTVNIIRGLGL